MAKAVPYEIHITVNGGDRQRFVASCNDLEVKAIVIDMPGKDGQITHMMTSSHYFGSDAVPHAEAARIYDGLIKFGFEPIRTKIETIPTHPQASKVVDDDHYFETHIAVKSAPNELDKLKYIADATGSHLSRNPFKKHGDNMITQMITYRDTVELSKFQHRAEAIRSTLILCGFAVEPIKVEYAIYDTNVEHDNKWLE